MSTQGEDHKSRERDRNFRSERSGRGNSRQRERGDKKISDRRVYVSNIPFEYRWQDVKDLFRDEVGKVARVELFTDEDGKPRGCGIVEFEQSGLVEEAVKKMHRYDIKGRKLVVKEDYDIERDQCGRLLTGQEPGKDREDRSRNQSRPSMNRQNGGGVSGGGVGHGLDSRNSEPNYGNTYGLSTQFLESLGINGPLVTKVFVANLDYKVDEKKLMEVFKLAGKVLSVELNKDKDGKSRGFGIVEFDHPVESVQAISMLNNQQLYDRRISVRLDRSNESEGPLKLPEGLKSVGMGLGAGGNRLTDVARNLPNMQTNNPPAVVNPFSSPVLTASTMPLAADIKNVVSAQLANALTSSNVAALQASLSGGLAANLPTNPLFNSAATNNLAGLANLESSLAAVQAAKVAKLENSRSSFETNNVFSNPAYNTGRISDDILTRRTVDSIPASSPGFMTSSSQVGDRRQNSSDTILIRNLPQNVTWQMLRDKFQTIGDVKYAEMKGNDAAMVKFSSEWDAARAASMLNNSRVDEKIIQVCLY